MELSHVATCKTQTVNKFHIASYPQLLASIIIVCMHLEKLTMTSLGSKITSEIFPAMYSVYTFIDLSFLHFIYFELIQPSAVFLNT